MNTETSKAILAEVMAEVEKLKPWQLELVYVDYRHGFTEGQVAAVARGDFEALYDATDDWVSGAQWEGAHAVLNDLVAGLDDWDEAVLQDWLHTDEAAEVNLAIMERDTSTPLAALAGNSGNVLLRIRANDGYVEDDAEDEVHYWIAAVNVIDLYELGQALGFEGKVRLSKAFPWRGDVWSGGGMVADEEHHEIVVDRADLRTDKDAAGYSWTETACPVISYYESAIEPITEEVS